MCLWVQCKWNNEVNDLVRVGLAFEGPRMSTFSSGKCDAVEVERKPDKDNNAK
jgi:hypothetical protein